MQKFCLVHGLIVCLLTVGCSTQTTVNPEDQVTDLKGNTVAEIRTRQRLRSAGKGLLTCVAFGPLCPAVIIFAVGHAVPYIPYLIYKASKGEDNVDSDHNRNPVDRVQH